ncbi:hypothetical protein [Litoreibacter janthinus]|uniref:Uncharacterized protein n=1 Tax=Litoreibacter janthinus TaxID=670154 RepID=A0A1I6HDC7_9RHOB|nr:hypothetical protein [Litoreibacter janthinus]SFR52340.1 hypothetical protein SAMN04488002_2843 [Litoreibacter janthinus]
MGRGPFPTSPGGGSAADDLARALRDLYRRLNPPMPRPVPPPPIPVPVPVPGNPPAPAPGTVPGTTPGAQAPPAIPESLTGEGYEAPPFTGTNTQTRLGETVRAENRIRRRTKSCCHPVQFRTVWLRRGNVPVSNRMRFRPTFDESDFLRGSGGQVAIQRGHQYQIDTCGNWEYTCRGGGRIAQPDGERSASCWMREAKYQMPRPTRGFGDNDYTPPHDASRIQRQFQTYGVVANNPDPPARPCWHIGLDVNCSQAGGPIVYYYGLLVANRLAGIVRHLPAIVEAYNEINRANEALRNRDAE